MKKIHANKVKKSNLYIPQILIEGFYGFYRGNYSFKAYFILLIIHF